MARGIYSLLLRAAVPLVLLRLLWRGRKNPAYRLRWAERFGRFPAPQLHEPIWIHAVSVGETQAAAPLIHALMQRHPERSLVVTTTTPTGSQRVRDLFGERVFHVYLPYDLPGAVARFLDRVRPRLALVMETELWPNLFHHCAARDIPVVIANARLSPRSTDGYSKLGSLARETLADVRLVAARDEADAKRFRELGAPRVVVMGNLKFDQHLPEDLASRSTELRAQWGARPVWIAASTHEGEEEQVLEAFARVREHQPDVLLVLVPRHPERFAKVAALAERRGFRFVRRTENRACDAATNIFLGDTMGELPLFYASADVAFVGGSLVATGGHNMLEPAALGVPVVFGQHLFNFTEVAAALRDAGGARQVNDAQQLGQVVSELLADAAERKRMGEAGRKLVAENRGALQRLLDLITPYIG